MNQTAVQWLIKKLQNRQNGIFDGLPHLSVDQIYEKANQMFEEQIKDAWLNSLTKGDYHSAEEYYNETFKSE
jgi:hypothetical protein